MESEVRVVGGSLGLGGLPTPQHLLSKSIFSTMFLGLMLSSWLQMKMRPGSGSVHPYLLIQTFS